MKTKILLLVFFWVALFSVSAQDIDLHNFTGLKSSGDLPKCFRELSAEKYEKAKESISKYDSRFTKSSKQDFYLKSNFVIDDILLSGQVVFGDPITNYVNDVADILLDKHPVLRGKIQIVVSKSHIANAFATDQGIIFINTGLVARMNSEAELAYCLAHEIAHYAEEHIISMHIEKDRFIQNRGGFRNVSFSDYFLNVNRMSQEIESEADAFAYEEYYKNTNYCLDEIDSIFHTLLLAQAPFAERKFDNSFFESKYYKFPSNYLLEELDTVAIEKLKEEDFDSASESTHPATMNRKKAVSILKDNEQNDSRQKFLLGKGRFLEIRALAQFESIRQMMIGQEYIDALYNCYGLLEQYPDNRFLHSTIASALYFMSTYKTHSKEGFSNEYSPHSTEIKQFGYFIKKLDTQEITILAIKNLQEFIEEFGSTEYHDIMLDYLVYDLFFENKIKKDDFFIDAELEEDISLNNPDKEQNELYYLNAFASLLDSKEFSQKMSATYKAKKEADKLEKMFGETKKDNPKKLERQLRKKQRKGEHLGLDKIAVISPFYFKINAKKKEPIQLIESEKKQLRFANRIRTCAEVAQLDVQLLNPKEYNKGSIDDFNNVAALKEWFMERLQHGNEFDIIPYCSETIGSVVDALDTEHVYWTGVFALRKKKRAGYWLAGSLYLFPYAFPVVLTWALIPSYQTTYFSFLFNVKTGKNELYIGETMSTSDLSGDFVKAHTYDSFHQIKRKSKVKSK